LAPDAAANRVVLALAKPPGLWPFLVAGYPDLETTESLLRRLAELPIRGVELGFPFSDPIADGPVIQHAFTHALATGLRVEDIFRMVQRVRPSTEYPLFGMVSASIVFRRGPATFVERAAEAGLDGLIIPDISLEEAPLLAAQTAAAAMQLSMLVAPTTPAERQKRIAGLASGFLYYVSVQGVTGERDRLPAGLEKHVREVRENTSRPVLVGFGISRREHVREVCRYADGAIVGSAIVHHLRALCESGAGRESRIEGTLEFMRGLGA